jgi:hypothetical protein
MAQTRRKRQTKHRGNAAGVVEARGRTGRKPTAAEKGGKASQSTSSKDRLRERQERPPTWRGATVHAGFAAVMMVAILLIFNLTKVGSAIALFPIVLLLYIPVSYYTDHFMYKRRKAAGARKGKAAGR